LDRPRFVPPAGANLREKRARGAGLAIGGKGVILVVQKP
jgi:hypothetical protein